MSRPSEHRPLRLRALLVPLFVAVALLDLAAWAQTPPEPQTSTATPIVSAEPAATPAETASDEAADAAEEATDEEFVVPSRLTAPPIATAKPLPRELDLLAQAKRKGDALYLRQADGDVELTVNPELQAKLTEILKSYQTPYAAIVAIEPSTGRVLAMAEHSEADPSMRGLPTKAIFPAASTFKVITASALLDEGVTPETTECSFGGKRRISAKMLVDSGRDTNCLSLQTALAKSANSVFAKFTHKFLTPEKLKAKAEAYHFNSTLDFPIPVEPSLAAFPEEPFAFASTGAGFGDVFMSPLQGALIASVAANKGQWHAPLLREKDVGKGPANPEQVIPANEAELLTQMMEETVTSGTARRVFRQRGFKVEGAVGKTGCLADKKPFRDYTWFIGFAPKNDPKIAVAAVVVNDMKWRIRATWLGREALRLGLESEAKKVAARKLEREKLVSATTAN